MIFKRLGVLTHLCGVALKTFFGDDNGIGSVSFDKTKLDNIIAFVGGIADIAVKINGIWDVDATLIQDMFNSLSALSIPDFDSDGIVSANAFLSALSKAIQTDTTVVAASSALSMAGVNAVRATNGNWISAGRFLVVGLANGMTANTSFIANAARRAMQSAINAANRTAGINSPSRVFAEMGMYIDEGLAGGLRTYAYLAETESRNVAQGTINTARSALSNLVYMVEDIDSEPTIRPVMDLSDITNGFQTIDGLLNTERMLGGNYFTGLSSIRNTRDMTLDQGKMANRGSNEDVVAELKQLSKQFDDLSSAVANMQVVLDTGVLVGQTSAQMDTQLGTLASRRGRGN